MNLALHSKVWYGVLNAEGALRAMPWVRCIVRREHCAMIWDGAFKTEGRTNSAQCWGTLHCAQIASCAPFKVWYGVLNAEGMFRTFFGVVHIEQRQAELHVLGPE
jgi:hypothetical protein